MDSPLAPLALLAVGLVVAGFGVYVWRSARSIVEDARRTLLGMFGEGFPGLFAGDPDPRTARIAGVGIAGLGVAVVVAGVVLLVVR